jgi:hypothetical protein
VIPLAVLLMLSVEPSDCTRIKEHIAQYGKIATYTRALASGLSPKEISRIRKACGI